MENGEIKIAIVGEKTEKESVIGGWVTLIKSDGSASKYNIVDVLKMKWYDETA